MEHLRWTIPESDRPVLHRPVLVVAFEGWNDAGDAATTAVERIGDQVEATKVAGIDPEPFYDFNATRPFVRIDGEGGRRIEWPANDLKFAAFDRDGDAAGDAAPARHDLIVLRGVEPQLRWRTFAGEIAEFAAEAGVELVVSLGALIADVAHSRPTTVFGTSADPTLCARLDLEPSNYEGPTGIVGVLHDACRQAGVGSVSLWASVPSYVPHASSPKAALALLDRFGTLAGLPILGGDLVEEAADYERQIDELVEADDETAAYVRDLERRYDESMGPDSGDNLISELEQFLREQN
ncbi:MAG: PAC2 family protein [Acidimicrobiales bacterium]